MVNIRYLWGEHLASSFSRKKLKRKATLESVFSWQEVFEPPPKEPLDPSDTAPPGVFWSRGRALLLFFSLLFSFLVMYSRAFRF